MRCKVQTCAAVSKHAQPPNLQLVRSTFVVQLHTQIVRTHSYISYICFLQFDCSEQNHHCLDLEYMSQTVTRLNHRIAIVMFGVQSKSPFAGYILKLRQAALGFGRRNDAGDASTLVGRYDARRQCLRGLNEVHIPRGQPGSSFCLRPTCGCGLKPMGSYFGVGAPPMLVDFSGDWDVHWGILTHGRVRKLYVGNGPSPGLSSQTSGHLKPALMSIEYFVNCFFCFVFCCHRSQPVFWRFNLKSLKAWNFACCGHLQPKKTTRASPNPSNDIKAAAQTQLAFCIDADSFDTSSTTTAKRVLRCDA